MADAQCPTAQLRYEWWPAERVKRAGILEMEGQAHMAAPEVAGEASDLSLFAQMLREHNIDPRLFGRFEAKTLEQLAAEVRSGAARLMLDATEHKKLVRVVDVVVLRLVSGQGEEQRVLVEMEECYPDGRRRETGRLPGTKKEPHENTRQTAWRIVKEMLVLGADAVRFDLSEVGRHEEETESPSYPGVRTVYRKEVVECSLLTSAGTTKSSWSAADTQGYSRLFAWLSRAEAEARKVRLGAEEAGTVSTLVRAPLGLTEEALQEHLTGLGVDVAAFGQGGTRSLREFSSELLRGEANLMQDASGALRRVVDVVLLVITKPTGETLVQAEQLLADGHRVALNRLPGAKRRPDENHFLSARRILRRQLEIDENQVRLNQEVEFVEDEKPSPSYPGLTTLYRKRLIRAEVLA